MRGDTIFAVEGVDIEGWGGEFIASSQLATLRREALERLRAKRLGGVVRGGFCENPAARYPTNRVGARGV